MQRSFKFHFSRLLTLIICIGHGVAVAALEMIPMQTFALILLFAVLVWSVIYFLLRDALLVLPVSWIGLRLEDEHLILFNRRGDALMGRLLRSSVVTPNLVILNIAIPNYRWAQNVVLMPDSMDDESFRQLRVALKWGVVLTA